MTERRRKNAVVMFGTALGCLLAFFAVLPVFAQGVDLGLEYATATGLGTTDIRTTVATIIRIFLGLLGVVAVVIILYAGFLWMTAGGNEERVSTAKKWLLNGVIGLAIILSAYAIVSFIFGAITGGGTGTGLGSGTCPEGQVCDLGGGGGGPGDFTVRSIMPEGSGPGGGGYPKNSSVRTKFSMPVDTSSFDPESFEMQRCNPRIDGSGAALAFDDTSCTQTVTGAFAYNSSLVTFTSLTPCPEQADLFCLDADYWYRVVLASSITSASGVPLSCPLISVGPTGEYWTSAAQDDLCERAFATNDKIDTAPPTISVSIPASPPGYCQQTINVQAVVSDDAFPTVARFRLQAPGGQDVDAFVNAFDGSPHDGIVANAAGTNPFSADELAINTDGLNPGDVYKLIAVGEDTVPNVSGPFERRVILNPLHCCNDVVDDPPETGLNCGPNGVCGGACVGDTCTDGSQCASGSCADGFCAEPPLIESVSPVSGGPGTLVTLRGKFFGDPGHVVFLGGPGDDDVIAQACAAQAWVRGDDGQYTVTVSVPEGAVDGPLMLVNSRDLSDDTTGNTPGFVVDPFVPSGPVPPGICYLSPNAGTAGAEFTVHGIGFGADRAQSFVKMGMNAVTLKSDGWTDTAIDAFAPSAREGIYPVTVIVDRGTGATVTNAIDFSLRPEPGEETPRIDEVVPSSGPIGTYITIVGSGFGHRIGTVRFISGSGQGEEIAVGEAPACSDYWKRSYIIIKVPERYQTGTGGSTVGSIVNRLGVDGSDGVHAIEVEAATSIPKKSNRVDFTINTETRRPGMCSISPDNGPPGKQVQVTGEGFGPGPADMQAPNAFTVPTRNTVDFYVSGDVARGNLTVMSAVVYSSWNPALVSTYVPGTKSLRATWPASGPVFLVADDVRSSNAVPFLVQDCNESGCPTGSVCCASGSCDEPQGNAPACQSPNRDSAYGWRLSTMTLPTLPRVVEQSCTDTILQSPAPARSSMDACVDAYVQVQFTSLMDEASFGPESVIVQKCGTGEAPTCTVDETADVIGGRITFKTEGGGTQTVMMFEPTGLFEADTWHRVILASRPGTDPSAPGPGLVEAETGRYLDGDRDNRQGGDYVFTFKTRNSTAACELDHVTVSPAIYTIDHQGSPPSVPGDPAGFFSTLVAANCNPLRCTVPPVEVGGSTTYLYNIVWSTNETPGPDQAVILDDQLPPGACRDRMAVTADRETPGSSVTMTASASVAGIAGLARDGDTDIKVKFADPYVAEYAPQCPDACNNTGVRAAFNVPMDSTLFDANRIQIVKCRNASCNPPFVAADQPTNVTFQTVQGERPEDIVGVIAYVDSYGERGFIPGSYYRVRVLGGAGGLLSASGVPLTRLNETDSAGSYFTWMFRTRDSGEPCDISSASIIPPSVAFEYVGDRSALTVIPRAEPDACDPRGQVLDPREYDWNWGKREEAVSSGSVVEGFLEPDVPTAFVSMSSRVDTASRPAAGCTSRCTLVGSQNKVPQCGNGKLETGEQCEINFFGLYDDRGVAAGAWPSNCSDSCLWLGTALESEGGTCGNGSMEYNETCDFAGGVPGCTEALPGFLGCVVEGASTAPGTMCGDGTVGDGEDCDDGNGGDGDGCSSDCLAEGTLQTCYPDKAGGCVNFCGNGIDEPGEDPDCDLDGGGVDPACDQTTCRKKGICSSCGTCGNGRVEGGEECDPAVVGEQGCTKQCLFAGSSWKYDEPSFCGDGILGYGEAPQCDGPERLSVSMPEPTVSISADNNADPLQLIVAGSYSGEEQARATVTAGAGGLAEADYGRSEVTLSCVCNQQTAMDPQEYCSTVRSGYGCDTNGCCAPAPIVDSHFPLEGSTGQCRNTGIRIVFNEDILPNSIEAIVLAEREPAGGCGEREVITLGMAPAPAAVDEGGWFSRIIDRIAGFFRSLFLRVVNAQSATRYCSIPTEATVTGKTVRLAPTNALAGNTLHLVSIRGGGADGVIGMSGVPLGATVNFNFTTGPDICAIENVTVEPASYLFAHPDETEREFSAVAHPENAPADAEIVSVPEYAFKWRWQLQPPTSSFQVAPTIAERDTMNGYCEDGESPESGDCAVDLAAAPAPKPPSSCGNAVCEAGRENAVEDTDGYCPEDCAVEPGHKAIAMVKVVQGSSQTPISTVAAEGVIRVSAETATDRVVKETINCNYANINNVDPDPDGNCGEVTAMLCDNPWPEWQRCSRVGGRWQATLPWNGQVVACPDSDPVWYPFWDTSTDVSFFYCRDGAAGSSGAGSGGAVYRSGPLPVGAVPARRLAQAASPSGGQEILPALSDRPSRIEHSPATGLLREYLFTFAAPTMPWGKDAIGLRFATNLSHRSVKDWYADRGFRGAPTPVDVGGYQGLRDDRTTYVNAAAATSQGLYTNMNVLSYTDGATPETVAVYDQIVQNIDFNRSIKDSGYCIDYRGDQVLVNAKGDRVYSSVRGGPVSCTADVECRIRPDGTAYPGSAQWYCQAPEAKLQRDVLRYGDLLKSREELLRVGKGSYPTLIAGTYLPALTTSAWASWDGVLSEEAGVLVAKDPVNSYAECQASDAAYEQGTCWNQADQLYMCPVGSQVYAYNGLGGQDFTLSGTLESACDGLPRTVCTETPGCDYTEAAGAGGLQEWMPNYLCRYYGACTYDDAFVMACRIWGYLFPECGQRVDPWYVGQFAFCARDGRTYDYLCRDYYPAGTTGCSVSAGTWYGDTCLDKTAAECGSDECEVVEGVCQFKDGKIRLTGSRALPSRVCDGSTIGAGQACGDGVVSSDPALDDCEPGQTRPGDCETWFDPEINQSRPGTKLDRCTEICTWDESAVCSYGSCGDGIVQEPELCDDGALNGTYGNCRTNCSGAGDACGDGTKQPTEACDCSALNGAYTFNGVLATAAVPDLSSDTRCRKTGTSAPSCSWDCSEPSPRCGDDIINGSEVCDGGAEVFKGHCSDAAETGCDTNADCPAGSTCGNFCGDPNDPLDPRRASRTCNSNDASLTSDDIGSTPAAPYGKACTWSQWTCTGSGDCGNGTMESGEECDELQSDGPTGDAGQCVMHDDIYECKLNRCGDGYVYGAGGEECDEGTENGQICNPLYDRSCTYCTASCKVKTVSGGFCGNGLLEAPPSGPEECDGPTGFEGTWLCVSDRIEHASWGLYTGEAVCGARNCEITCADPYSRPCRNDVTLDNADASYGSAPDTQVWPAGKNAPDFFDTKDYFRNAEPQVPLTDACDPDDDGDGVPDNSRAECGPPDIERHGAYTYPFTGIDYQTRQPVSASKVIDIPEYAEACVGGNTSCATLCDGKDNNCNDDVDEGWMKIAGNMVFGCDAGAAEAAAEGIRIRVYCGTSTSGTYLAGTRTDASGRYVVEVPIAGCGSASVYVYANKDAQTAGCFEVIRPWGATVTKGDHCDLTDDVDFIVGRPINVNVTVKSVRTGQSVGTNEGRVRGRLETSTTWLASPFTNASGVAVLTLPSAPGCDITWETMTASGTCKDAAATGTVTDYSTSCTPLNKAVSVELPYRPIQGDVSTWITWSGSQDQDLVGIGRGYCAGYSCSNCDTSPCTQGELSRDRDQFPGPGTETVSVDGAVSDTSYKFYVEDFDDGTTNALTFYWVGNSCTVNSRSLGNTDDWVYLAKWLNGSMTWYGDGDKDNPTF